jgi:gas vesicle protein
MNAKHLLIGITSGIAAGLVTGILLAPDKGSNTRRKITEGASQLGSKFQFMKHNAGKELTELKEVFSENIAGLKDDVRERVLKLIDESSSTHKRRMSEREEVLYS